MKILSLIQCKSAKKKRKSSKKVSKRHFFCCKIRAFLLFLALIVYSLRTFYHNFSIFTPKWQSIYIYLHPSRRKRSAHPDFYYTTYFRICQQENVRFAQMRIILKLIDSASPALRRLWIRNPIWTFYMAKVGGESQYWIPETWTGFAHMHHKSGESINS